MSLLKTRVEIVNWLDKNKVKSYIIGEDLSVDVAGSVLLTNGGLSRGSCW